ncbi:MAG: MFS transporter [Burkholderiaceae bacterium]
MSEAASPDPAADASPGRGLGAAQLAAYGLFGLPLSLVALPIYVYVPKYYSDAFGLSLEAIGIVLMAVRLLDAGCDPIFGWWVDHRRVSAGRAWLQGYRKFIVIALPLLSIGYLALFSPPGDRASPPASSAAWLVGALVVVYAGYSLANIAYYGWGADLGSSPAERTQVTGTREGFGLVGVLVAAAVPQALGMHALSLFFLVSLGLSVCLLLWRAPHPVPRPLAPDAGDTGPFSAIRVPLANPSFVSLLSIFLANGIASAIPATLVLFYIRDVLDVEARTALLLGVYFLAAACSMPLWVSAARRFGLARSWFCGMILSVVIFVWVFFLSAHDFIPFMVICIFSGMAIGGDLALPPALVAGVIAKAGQRGVREGSYFGLWSLATKLNLALAAGISLPLLGALGYDPGRLTPAGVHALSVGYGLVPCGLKLCAAWLLWRSRFWAENA